MKTTTIVTVGTSIIGNIERNFSEFSELLKKDNYKEISDKLKTYSVEKQKMLSAELNSTISMISSGIIETHRIVLIVSDTAQGRTAGKLLESIFKNSDLGFSFKEVITKNIAGLNDVNFEIFKKTGLMNLVKTLSSLIRNYQGGVCINNTGGYKAEIAFAGIIGQAFSIPVYYQFENFGSMIELPPLPISVDYMLFKDNIELFMQLADFEKHNELLKLSNKDVLKNDKMCQLIEVVEEGSDIFIGLSPAGHIFVESCKYNMYKSGYLNDSDIPESIIDHKNKEINLCGDHHGNDRLNVYAKKICKSKYINRIICSLNYNPKANDPVKRILCENNLWYIDFVDVQSDAGYTLRAECTARNEDEAKSIAARISSEL